jgi:hypothetical protein
MPGCGVERGATRRVRPVRVRLLQVPVNGLEDLVEATATHPEADLPKLREADTMSTDGAAVPSLRGDARSSARSELLTERVM